MEKLEKKKNLELAGAYLIPIIGICCLIIPEGITNVLPYLLGATMVATAVLKELPFIIKKERNLSANTAENFIMFVMGIAFIAQGTGSIGIMGTVWGLLGLEEGAKGISEVLELAKEKKPFAKTLVITIIKLCLALALLFNPFEKFTVHIAVLGLEMIATTFTLPFKKKSDETTDVKAK